MRIDSEVKNFFKMAGLDKIGQNKTQKDKNNLGLLEIKLKQLSVQ